MGIRSFRAVVAAVALCIAGCASIPLSTMVGMSRMSMQSLVQVDPAEIRIRLSVPEGFEVDAARTHLTFSVRNPAVEHSSEFDVRVLEIGEGERPGGLFEPDLAVATYMLALTPESQQAFRAFQQVLLGVEHGTFEAGFRTHFSERPPGARDVTLWVDLKLSDAESFMPLLDGARVEFGDS